MTRCVLLAFLATACSAAPSADAVMRRVAENQQRANQERARYVYDMNVFVRLKRANGKVAREEERTYVVAPGAKGAERTLGKVDGKLFEGSSMREYHESAFRTKDSDIDGAITDSFARDLLWRKGAFGPMMNWFPLEKNGSDAYTFRMLGEEKYRQYDVYRIDFRANEHEDDNCWRGEVLVERNDMQPVLVTTEWACRIPMAVQVMLGTRVRHIGAKITFERFGEDLWFPVKCGGEMKLRVLFVYARTIAFSATNSGFRKTAVDASVQFEH